MNIRRRCTYSQKKIDARLSQLLFQAKQKTCFQVLQKPKPEIEVRAGMKVLAEIA